MTHNRFTVLDEIQRHPDLAEQTAQAVHRVAPTVKEMTDRRVLDLLFELTQQAVRFVVGLDPWRSLTVHDPLALTQAAVRFGSATDPWVSLAVYDADGFAPFIRGGQA